CGLDDSSHCMGADGREVVGSCDVGLLRQPVHRVEDELREFLFAQILEGHVCVFDDVMEPGCRDALGQSAKYSAMAPTMAKGFQLPRRSAASQVNIATTNQNRWNQRT